MARCTTCKRDFKDRLSLEQHLRTSPRHAWCERCQKDFRSLQARNQHHWNSSRHNLCALCSPELDFESKTILNAHLLDVNQPHIEESKFSVDPVTTVDGHGYEGIPKVYVTPVFSLARRLRFSQPSADDIIKQTTTPLSREIVAALIDAAVRLLPPDPSPAGLAARQQKDKEKNERALRAETAFLEHFNTFGYRFLSELQQKKNGNTTMTPDIRFHKPTLICGHLCFWLEYKHFFGFRANPFIASSVKKQLRKYATGIGPGAVVYRLGFESGHVNIDGVMAFREHEVLASLSAQKNLEEE